MFNLKKRFLLMFSLALSILLVSSPQVHAQPVLSDIKGHWAKSTIQTLAQKGVINGYPDGLFRPEQAITRAEFATLVAKIYNYSPSPDNQFSDVTGHWGSPYINAVAGRKVMNAFADGNFKPDKALNRAQIVTMFSRILNLAKPEEKYEDWKPSFSDVPNNHWAFRYVEIAKMIGILPSSYQTKFQPERLVTRAEAVSMLQALSQITVNRGKISHIDMDTGLVNIQGEKNGEPLLSMVVPETIILRNNATSSIENLLEGDEVTAITTVSGDVKFLKAFGKVTKNDLLSRISSMTKGYLKPNHISSILSGDWEAIKDDIKGGIYQQLIEFGLTPAEAESLIVQDWNYLDSLSRDRLSQALSNYLGISLDFSQALLDRDLDKIKEFGKVELATVALSRLLGVNE
jgi:hypothetical protein